MNTKRTERTLVDEIMKYLETVELFRSLGQEPCWRPRRCGRPLFLPTCRRVPSSREALTEAAGS